MTLLPRLTIFLTATLASALAHTSAIPATGRNVPELAAYDAVVRSVMQKWAVPGPAAAITDQGRLVYAREH